MEPPPSFRIALDVMGGDHGPELILSGAAMALKTMPDLRLLLVGNTSDVEPRLARAGIEGETRGRVKLVHSDSVVAMEDKATAILKEKKGSSIRIAAELVSAGEADGMVSMGHTGAATVASIKIIGTLPGVERPCLAAIFPSLKGTPTVFLDVGANVDCKADHIAQFALMGGVYAEEVLGVASPKIGVLSIGEEDHKGSKLTRQASEALKAQSINFGGNAEGRDIWNGDFDVVACDGFVGNVVLKASESLAEGISHGLKETLEASFLGRFGGLLVRPSIRRFYKKLDYAEHGGAPLLGVKGISIIGHGRSNERAVGNAIRAAVRGVKNNVNARIQERLHHLLQSSQKSSPVSQ